MTDDSVPVNEESFAETSPTLLSRIRKKEAAAWERLVTLYGPLVTNWCVRLGVDSHDAENITQEVFLSIDRSLGDFHRQRTGSFRRWLKTNTTRKCIDHFRKSNRERIGTAEELELQLDSEPHVESDKQVLYERAMQLIQQEFSQRDLTVFRNVVIENKSPQDIAEQMEVTTNVVYLVVSRILKRLRSEFSELIELQNRA